MKIAIGVVAATTIAVVAGPVSAATADKPAQTAPSSAVAPSPSATAPVNLDERLGCGVLLVTIDEVLQRNPQLVAQFSKGDKNGAAMVPMFRLLGASGEIMLDKAYAEGATQGLTPTTLYRRGVAQLSSKFAQGTSKDAAMEMFGRCMQVASPQS